MRQRHAFPANCAIKHRTRVGRSLRDWRFFMPPEQWAHAVAASVAPVVIISASALLCLALYNRLAAIISRMRAVQRERLTVQERIEGLSAKEMETGAAVRLTVILESLADQTGGIRRRGRVIRNSLLCLLSAIGSLVVCSLMMGLTIFMPAFSVVAAGLFVLGLLMLLTGVIFAAVELHLA